MLIKLTMNNYNITLLEGNKPSSCVVSSSRDPCVKFYSEACIFIFLNIEAYICGRNVYKYMTYISLSGETMFSILLYFMSCLTFQIYLIVLVTVLYFSLSAGFLSC